jgi:cell division protein FtsB
LKSAEGEARLAQNLVRHVTDPKARGSDNANKLRAWLVPNSRFRLLIVAIQKIEPLAPAAAAQLKATRNSIETHLSALQKDIADIHSGPVRAAAEKRAHQDMVRPREVIDTLRYEANSYAFSLIGIADAGRIWPDSNGTRFAFGGGGRVSLVNVNFTLGYAVNPSPHKELGQGRGALLIGFTYTNLFR